MNKNIQAILNMLDSNTFQRGVLLDILESYGKSPLARMAVPI